MDPLEKATAILAAATGATATEVAELLTSDDGETQLTGKLEAKLTDVRDKADKRATSKTRTDVEKAFKAAGVEDASFDALPAAIEAVQNKAAAATPAALTDEQALKLPAVVKALNAVKAGTDAAVEAARAEERTRLENDRKAFDQKRTETTTRSELQQFLKTKNPNYRPGKETAEEKLLIDEIMRRGKFQLGDDGKPQLVDDEGNLLPGKLGNGFVKWEDFATEIAEEIVGLPVSTQRDNAGLTQDQVDASKNKPVFTHFKGEMPKTEAELLAIRADQSIPLAARQEVKAAWETAHPPQ